MTDGKCILVIEDDETQRHFYKTVLENVGYSVTGVCSIDKAIKLIETNIYDLYIVDVLLNGRTDGISMVSSSFRPLLIISGLKFDGLETVNYLQKPVSVELLRTTVDNIISTHRNDKQKFVY